MGRKIVIVGGGAAGIGAAGGAKAADPQAEVVVYTEFEDVGYSPCGIPYVHGKEIDDFQRLFLATKEAYVQAGIDIRYTTTVDSLDLARQVVHVAGEGDVPWDSLVVATGFNYADPGVPGADLDGLYYVKNIRQAMEWDKVLDTVKVAVVVEASPLGVEMTTALAHRGIETHLVDPAPVAARRDGRSRHHGAGRGVLARARGHDAHEHHAEGLPRRRGMSGRLTRRTARSPPTSPWCARTSSRTTRWPPPPA